jgi:transposase InsO family protein
MVTSLSLPPTAGTGSSGGSSARAAGGRQRRKGVKTTVRDRDARPAPDRVQRCFTAERPDRLWVADITYVATLAGFLFLAVVMDVTAATVSPWPDVVVGLGIFMMNLDAAREVYTTARRERSMATS